MKYTTFLLTCLLWQLSTFAQDIQLTDHLLFPRLDSFSWYNDYRALNSQYSFKANKYQVCTAIRNDSTHNEFCFNTTLGHVQLDSTLPAITHELLTGSWQLTLAGVLEVTDSLPIDASTYTRRQFIGKENKTPIGRITFTEGKVTFKDIDDIPNSKASYTIVEGKYLRVKKLFTGSTSTILGLTQDNHLFIDIHTYRKILYRDKAMVAQTTIRRWILKKA